MQSNDSLVTGHPNSEELRQDALPRHDRALASFWKWLNHKLPPPLRYKRKDKGAGTKQGAMREYWAAQEAA